MSFNKRTWTEDMTNAKGLGQLSAEDARRKGFEPRKRKSKVRVTVEAPVAVKSKKK